LPEPPGAGATIEPQADAEVLHPAEPAVETTAAYLARRLIVERGYKRGVPVEAVPFAARCDIALTYSDGVSFVLVGIIDREKDPQRRFDVAPDVLVEIGRACLKYTGRFNFNKMPVGIQLWEVGRSPITAADRERLVRLNRAPGLAKVGIGAWALDASTGTAWKSTGWRPQVPGQKYLEQVLRGPRLDDAALEQLRPPEIATHTGAPWATIGLLLAMVAGFAAEFAFGFGERTSATAPGVPTLVALGGLSRSLVVEAGEWYRLFTAPFLHGDFFHLLFNGVALWMAGSVVERLLGRRWLLALFVLGALGGSLMSMAVNPAGVVSVGASGAILGLFAAAIVVAQRLPRGAARTQIQMTMVQVLVPSLLPLAMTRVTGTVDFAAHFGGAILGAAAGLVVLRVWPREERAPRHGGAAKGVALGGAVLVAASFVLVGVHYDEWSRVARAADRASELIPDAELPTSLGAGMERAADFVARFPHDPRAQLFLGFARLRQNDLAGAESAFRAGLAEEEILRTNFSGTQVEPMLRAALGELLQSGGRDAEAREVLRPVCAMNARPEIADWVKSTGVCNAPSPDPP